MPLFLPVGGWEEGEERSARQRRKASRIVLAEDSERVRRSVPGPELEAEVEVVSGKEERRGVKAAVSSGCFSRPMESLERRRL